MSLIDDDIHAVQSDVGGSRIGSERHLTKFGKSKNIRLDSPTTIQACKELGILLQDLKLRNLAEFRDPNEDEDIVQIRYNHYLKRYNQNVKDVYARKRQLTRTKQRNERVSQQLHFSQLGLDAGPNGLKTGMIFPSTARAALNSTVTSNLKQSLLGPQAGLPSPMLNSYNKTMTYLRNSHNTSETKGLQDLVGQEASVYGSDDFTGKFDHALALEISKFNKVKRQKQKEALDVYDEEIKRVRMIEELKEKEKRNIERQKRQIIEKKKLEEEKRRKAEEKLEQLREVDRKFQMQKLEEKERIHKKLEEAKKKIAYEVEERRKFFAEQDAKLEMKRKQAEEMRRKLKRDEQTRSDMLKLDIDRKLYQSEEKYSSNLSQKTLRVKMQIQKIEESSEKMKEKQQLDAEEYVQKLVEKLVQKEESLRKFQHQHHMELKKREKELGERNQRFQNHQSDIKQEQRDRMKEINDRFQKVQENLEAKRIQNEKELRIKQELTKLKMKDKQENYNRKLRQTQYERQQILEKQKYNEAKIQWLKRQKDILQQAKVEVSIQSKIEKERIQSAVQLLSKLITEVGSSTKLTEQQKKLLKEVLTPEDYIHLENEERRRKEEELEAEELRKLGNDGHIPMKA